MYVFCARALSTLFALIAAAGIAHPARAHGPETVTRKLGNDLFMAGSDVQSQEAVSGDAVLAGGRVATSGTVGGDQLVAGGRISLGANVDGGVYAVGGDLRLDGKVARNARIAAGFVEVGRDADVRGGLTVAAGQVEVNGSVGKYLQVAAGSARINGHVGGDADVASGQLNVGPGAVIDGVLNYRGPHPATVADGAQIRGGVQYNPNPWGLAAGRLHRFGVFAWLWLIGWMAAGSVLLALWPGFTASVSGVAQREPWMALLIGFVVLACVPVALMLLMISLIGIPLALLGGGLYLVLLPLGYLASATAIADGLLTRLRRGGQIFTRQRILMLLGVLLVLFLLTRIPVLGGIVGALVIVAGVGSLVIAGAARYRQA